MAIETVRAGSSGPGSSPLTGAARTASEDFEAYRSALAALSDRGRFGVRLGLGRIRGLLAALGEPQLTVRGALIGGTNGKGSVLALAGSALRAAGLRAGETPKPHLSSYRERLQIAGRPIEPGAFAAVVDQAIEAAGRLDRRLGPATEFELLTAATFRWLADEGVAVALVEVGLGGRLDATNAWDGGVAVITNVDLDHTDRLGSTIGAIAREKAAIVKRGDRAVTGTSGEARAIVARRAARLGVPLRVVVPAPLLGWDRDGIEVELPGLGATRVGLRGRHQATNVAIADALLDEIEAAGIASVSPAARRAGYASARWPGRLELVVVPASEGRTGAAMDVLLDGAHNPAGAAALATALDDLRRYLAGGAGPDAPPLTLVTGTMADKDVSGIVTALAGAPALRGARVIATTVEGARALPADALATRWRDAGAAAGLRVEVVADPIAAFERALSSASGPIVVTGSLYLVGRIRSRIVPQPELADPGPGP